jgi:hypothetical protein
MKKQMSLRARKDVASQVQSELDRLGKPRKWLAGKASCSEKTVQNVLDAKKTSGKTISKIRSALGLDAICQVDASDEAHGGYTLSNVSDYLGAFYAYRWCFSNSTHIVRSAFEIRWDKTSKCLRFEEFHCYDCSDDGVDARKDYSQSGDVYLSPTIGLLHFMTAFRGALRLVTLLKYRLNNPDDLMLRGLVLTQGKLGIGYQPSTAPIILEKTKDPNFSQQRQKVVVLSPGNADYDRVYRELLDTEKHGVNVTLAPEPSAVLEEVSKRASKASKAA